MRRPGTASRQSAGSATVEFIFMAPFILVIMALVWDLRAYIAHRTDLAREMYVVAELIASETGANPIENVIERAKERLKTHSAGTIAVAVVTRGTRRGETDLCVDDDAWCLPMVTTAWPPEPESGTWKDGRACAEFKPLLPPGGTHFQEGRPVLPNEVPADVDPPPAEPAWISRNMRPQEWWVVVDSCIHPDPGLLFGRLKNFGVNLFDVAGGAFVLRKRAAWGSVHDRGDCEWCEPVL